MYIHPGLILHSLTGLVILLGLFPEKCMSRIESFGPNRSDRTYEIVADGQTERSTSDTDLSIASGYESSQSLLSDKPRRRPSRSRGAQRARGQRHDLQNTWAVQQAKIFIQHKFAITDNEFYVSSSVRSRFGVTHVYFGQLVKGIPVQNGVMNVNVDDDGEILSYGNSFTTAKSPHETRENLHRRGTKGDQDFTPQHALLVLLVHLEYETLSLDKIQVETSTSDELVAVYTLYLPQEILAAGYEISAYLSYLADDKGKLDMGYYIHFHEGETSLEAFVSEHSRQVTTIVNWSADASYRVYPMGTPSPAEGDQVLVVNPEDGQASPRGWSIVSSQENATTTNGNNVHAQENWAGTPEWKNKYRPQADTSQSFNYPFQDSSEVRDGVDAALTNLFYWCNLLHDIFYHYGFNEEAGNFQDVNFDKGGQGNDGVVAFAQSGSKGNSAVFTTPPDGRQPTMRLSIWTPAGTARDAALSSDIIIHEYTHGVSTRLTGGVKNVGCLGWDEAAAMGEGWGDVFAAVLHMGTEDSRDKTIAIGSYVTGGKGLRAYPYSTDMKVNPVTYADVHRRNTPFRNSHEIGLIWGSMLYEVYWNMVDVLGFTDRWHSASLEHGNTLWIQLVVAGMQFQPCYPTFLQARDAILQAETKITGNRNQCLIWRGFAKRGLGYGASYDGVKRKADTSLPPQCEE
ncbi:hypothetical protein IWQ62_000529 [Dispira parvispora]|uniref:Extracellular metalloproteinase n=1 Tax=Dispira parvispora TaxID=1520584 RepID=A0A9W8AZZ8_9FUNG|nr:hypothetical protein IWQ62_000529 [Dispira parvispora]